MWEKSFKRNNLALVLLVLLVCWSSMPTISAQETVTISGTIRHDGNPVPDVHLTFLWEGGEAMMTTSANGMYQVSGIPLGTWVMYFVRPPMDRRLEYRNGRFEWLGEDTIKDFDLRSGHLLSGEFRRPDGSELREGFWMGVSQIDGVTPEGEWLGEGAEGGRFGLVLAPGFYAIMPQAPEGGDSRPDAVKPFYFPDTRVDLNHGDVTDLVVTLVEAPVPYPHNPPRADLITISEADADGQATVIGAPGTVEPMSAVAVFNLSARMFQVGVSDSSGGFSVKLYAPSGSALLVKYGASGDMIYRMWQEALGDGVPPGGNDINPLPGTIIYAGPVPERTADSQSFDMVSSHFSEEPRGWLGWQISGTLHGRTGPYGVIAQRGVPIPVTGRVRITSPEFNCDNPMAYHPGGHAAMQYVFGADGTVKPWGIWFASYLFTPTGLPIEAETFGDIRGLGPVEFGDQTCVGEHTLEATFSAFLEVAPDVPDGIYRPFIWFDPGGVPMSENVPQNAVWYGADSSPAMPPIVVGDVTAPHIPWTLFGNYPVNGHRGVQAREDVGTFMMPTRVITPPHRVVLPRLEERSGQPIGYRLDLGSHWISASERRQPNPPYVPFLLPSGQLTATVFKPDGSAEMLGPVAIHQSSVTTPTTPGGAPLDHGTGQVSDLYHLTTLDDRFVYEFDQYGPHTIAFTGEVSDVYGNNYPINSTYDFTVARILDLDPAQLPTTPYIQGDYFAPGLHVFPPVPASVTIQVTHLPYSDPAQAITHTFTGQANRFGVFQPTLGDDFRLDAPGEFRVDVWAEYQARNGTLWAGSVTWGNVVEATDARIEAHGRRTMAHLPTNAYAPTWYEVGNLPPELVDIEVCYPYFSGDIHWGSQNGDLGPADSIQAIITFKDKTPDQRFYNLVRQYGHAEGDIETMISVGEAPLSTATFTGRDPTAFPDEIVVWGYWYGSSERPDVHVREVVGSPWVATVYWRFNDTYGYQIGEGATGDLPGDLKWEFGGAVIRTADNPMNEYAAYSSLWVLLPDDDPIGGRITPPFQDATGASINGGPIMTLRGEEIDMLFLSKSIRPGDVLELGDVVAFSGHVGPPLDSQVGVRITSPAGVVRERIWHANRIGWLYDPSFDFVADEAGRWTVDVAVLHDRPYVGNGVIPTSHNTGTVLGTNGRYEFYVVPPESSRLEISSPSSGFISWPSGHVEPIVFQGHAPEGADVIHYTIHDKGVVIDQGVVTPNADGGFLITYDARALNEIFPFVGLTAHEGRWEGLADEVAINMVALGDNAPVGNTITLIGEEVFVGSDDWHSD
jgi:hypothetical protein